MSKLFELDAAIHAEFFPESIQHKTMIYANTLRVFHVIITLGRDQSMTQRVGNTIYDGNCF